MVLPSLHSELVCLESLQDILQKRLDLERAYTSSIAAWRTDTHKITLLLAPGLRNVFVSLVEAAENNIQSRQEMETRFESQIEGIHAATEGLRGYLERIAGRSKTLEEFDRQARKALEERELRYEKWKAWKHRPVPSTAARVWLQFKPKKSLVPKPTEEKMVDAYNLADMEVRRCLSIADVARCSFKDKVIAEVDVISIAYQVTINAITKCLRLFAEDQQDCASNASAGAGSIVKVACDTFGSLVSGIFQEKLASEAQDISTASIPYDDLESTSRYPTIDSQPITVGFSLPPYYFSCSASTKFVVNVFRQLVSFVHDNQAWDQYVIRHTPAHYSLAPTFREVERSWTGDEALNRDLLHSLGMSMCADLVKALLASFPEPLIDCSGVPAGNLRIWNVATEGRSNTTWAGPSNQDSEVDLVPLVPPLYNRPQGEMLRALCISLIPVFRGQSTYSQHLFYRSFSNLLTRKGGCIERALPKLIRELRRTILTNVDERDTLLHRVLDPTRNNALPTPSHPPARAVDVTQISPPSASRLASSSMPAVRYAPQSISKAISTAVEVEPKRGNVLVNNAINDSTRPSHTAPNPHYRWTTNDIDLLKHGFITAPKNNANASYTILLVGETSATKSSLLKFIANVLLGNDIDHYDLDILNRPPNNGGTVGQTALPHHYEIMSVSGTLVRILDTPGLANTHDVDIEQDENHKGNIVRYIERHVESLSAVLILTTENDFGRMEYTVSTWSAIFPKTLFNNIAFICPSFSGPLAQVFFGAIPTTLESSPVFTVDSPIMGEKIMKSQEPTALKLLVALFDWLDDLEPQPVKEIVSLYQKYQNIEAKTFAMLHQKTREIEINTLMTKLKRHSGYMNSYSDDRKRWNEEKDVKEKTAALIAVNEMVLHHSNQVANCATGDLVLLVEQCADLSVASSCSAQAKSAVGFLEAMKNNIDQDKRKRFKGSLHYMKGKLELLNKIEKDVQERVSG